MNKKIVLKNKQERIEKVLAAKMDSNYGKLLQRMLVDKIEKFDPMEEFALPYNICPICNTERQKDEPRLPHAKVATNRAKTVTLLYYGAICAECSPSFLEAIKSEDKDALKEINMSIFRNITERWNHGHGEGSRSITYSDNEPTPPVPTIDIIHWLGETDA